ncbi:MAG: hypothetical protein V7L10_01210, partial [Nostoc sp.]
MVEAAMDGMEAYLTTIIPGVTPCLSCLFPEKPDWNRRGFSVIGAVAGTILPEPLIVLLNWPKSFTRRPVVTKKYFCPVTSSRLKVTVLPLVVVFATKILVNCSVGLKLS